MHFFAGFFDYGIASAAIFGVHLLRSTRASLVVSFLALQERMLSHLTAALFNLYFY
jgi:hypothetical protein